MLQDWRNGIRVAECEEQAVVSTSSFLNDIERSDMPAGTIPVESAEAGDVVTTKTFLDGLRRKSVPAGSIPVVEQASGEVVDLGTSAFAEWSKEEGEILAVRLEKEKAARHAEHLAWRKATKRWLDGLGRRIVARSRAIRSPKRVRRFAIAGYTG